MQRRARCEAQQSWRAYNYLIVVAGNATSGDRSRTKTFTPRWAGVQKPPLAPPNLSNSIRILQQDQALPPAEFVAVAPRGLPQRLFLGVVEGGAQHRAADAPYQAPRPSNTISIRRFCARPCGVSLGAIGRVAP